MSIKELQKLLTSKGYRVVITPRKALGWPCFHCGETYANCQALGKLTALGRLTRGDRCCKRCKGKASH